MISESAEVRQAAREFLLENALIVSSKADTKKEDLLVNTKDVYEVYYNFSCAVNKIKPYQLLALNRGEEELYLKIVFSFDKPGILNEIFQALFMQFAREKLH